MKILSIGTDRKLFEENSAVRARQLDYASRVEEYHIIVYTLRSHGFGNKPIKISHNLWIYPTNSLFRFMYPFDAETIGKKIIKSGVGWVVTAQDPAECGLGAWFARRGTRATMQLQLHTDIRNPHFHAEGFLNKVRIVLSKFLLKRADCVRVVSERIKSSLIEGAWIHRSQVHVLPIRVDVDSVRNTVPEFDLRAKYPQFMHILLAVGRLEKEKNHELSLEVLKRVLTSYPDTGIVIVGDGSEMNSLKRKARRMGLKENVIFEGYQNDVIPYYIGADVYLNTSYYEGYGMTLIEAAAAGCPIVTTDVGVASEVLQDGEHALICKNFEADCLTEGVIRLLNNKDYREQLALHAQGVLEYKVKKSREQYLDEIVGLWEKCS